MLELGAVALATGAAVPALSGRVRAGLAAQIAGLALLGIAGFVALLGGTSAAARGGAGTGFRAGIAPAFGLDPLSGLFLALLALSALPTLIYADAYLAGIASAARRRAGAALMAAFLLSLVGVLAARSATGFLACWELMTMLPAAAILVQRRDGPVRAAVYAYLAITHVAGTGVWIAVLVLSHHGGLAHPHALMHAGAGAQTLVALAALIGFGAKAGLIPLHSWLPRAHPVAPAPMSALMSGMMVKVALYGMIRVEFESMPGRPLWLGLTLLAIGLISACGGVLWASAQRELKRLLAFSTVENVGIITMALGAALLLLRAGQPLGASLAFAAALLHTINHAFFKTLLFLGAGAFERATGSLELAHLGGLLRRMPWTGGAFMVGALAISGLPPFNGFSSEWLVLQSLLHVVRHGPLAVALSGALALAGLAATAAVTLLCFVKVAGLALLGNARSARSAAATEAPAAMRAGMGALAAGCVLLGLAPGLVLPTLASLLPGTATTGARLLRHAGLMLPGTGSLPTVGIAMALLLLTFTIWLARGFRAQDPQPAPSWACGQPLVAELAWTPAAFTKPLRLVLAPLMRPDRELDVVRAGGLTQRISYSSNTPSLIDRVLYEPAVRCALRAAALARRSQTGNVRTYATYLIGLLSCALVLLGTGILR